MRLSNGIRWMVYATLALVWPLVDANGQRNRPIQPNPNITLARFEEQSPAERSARPEGDERTATGPAASSDRKDTRLTLKDIRRLREQHVAPERIVEKVAEHGRGFDVTAEVAEELRRQGFRPVQIDAIKESSPDPLVPGRWLTTSGEQRDRCLETMKRIAAKSHADIEPIQSQHVTLWAAKDLQRAYLADIEKLEKFFRTKCAEPIRSGLDNRSTHIVLLNDRAEYEAWLRAMFDLFRMPSSVSSAYYQEESFKRPAYYSKYFVAISLKNDLHHSVVGGVGNMYFAQLAEPRQYLFDPLQTGFINWAETTVFGGSPTVMFHSVAYGIQTSNPADDSRNWSLLVRQRLTSHKATPLGDLLQMDSSTMWQAHYAEGWTLVKLLASQPAKFGKLLLTLREGGSQLVAIEKVYGWDEKRLTKEWRAYVMTRGVRAKN